MKYTRTIAFVRVVGGKHQTTAGELGTPTKAQKDGNVEKKRIIINHK